MADVIEREEALVMKEPAREAEPDPITAFVCVIEYVGEARLITCRRYDIFGEHGYVGAICSVAGGYRQFRCDRIVSVADAYTGEVLGDGSYFARFEPRSIREKAPTWGLDRTQKATLIAGLNVLAFIAHCDGKWHLLELEPIERFVCSIWLRKEWAGDPPIDEILAHARRLAPDADTFFAALRHYARSRTSTAVLKRAVADLIAADGVVCANEMSWGMELADHLAMLSNRCSDD
ncbi:hypothetical protein [Sphingomonas profundi]|uniref:hypothetical protein n=1 Tax=Alterirhizorhabdus profundi TaxID=2681549 RepID=UPI0012E85AFE|nr:hypothetical protein [Sphingomonas profundi]